MEDEKKEPPIEEAKIKDPSVDYWEKEAIRLKAKAEEDRIKMEAKIVDLKRTNKELEEKPAPEPSLSEEEIDNKINERVDAQVTQKSQQIIGDRLEELINEKAKGDKNIADVIRQNYEGVIKPTGNLKQDVDNAFAISNQKFMQTQMEEKQRADNAKSLAGKGGGAGQMPPAGERPLTPEEKKMVAGSNLAVKDGKIVSPAKEKYKAKMAQNFPNLQVPDDFEKDGASKE